MPIQEQLFHICLLLSCILAQLSLRPEGRDFVYQMGIGGGTCPVELEGSNELMKGLELSDVATGSAALTIVWPKCILCS
jgi:hypothetical protein